MDYNRPEVGVGVIVVKEGKILIGKRLTPGNGDGTWSCPGGHLELHESWEQCARREVMEEAGIEIKNVSYFDVTNDPNPEAGTHYITILMRAEYASGEVTNCEPHKLESWHWKRWEEIPQPVFLPIANVMRKGAHPFATRYDKLVRDRIPEIIAERGDLAVTHEATLEEYKQLLQLKLLEEMEEYFQSEESEELADLLEVIHSLTALHGTHREQLQLIQKHKRDERGGFENRIVLEETRPV